jgi:hypothetical protein
LIHVAACVSLVSNMMAMASGLLVTVDGQMLGFFLFLRTARQGFEAGR